MHSSLRHLHIDQSILGDPWSVSGSKFGTSYLPDLASDGNGT